MQYLGLHTVYCIRVYCILHTAYCIQYLGLYTVYRIHIWDLHGPKILVIVSWDEGELSRQVVLVDVELIQRIETAERVGHRPHKKVAGKGPAGGVGLECMSWDSRVGVKGLGFRDCMGVNVPGRTTLEVTTQRKDS